MADYNESEEVISHIAPQQFQETELIKWQLETQAIIDNIKHNLRNEEFVIKYSPEGDQTGEWKKRQYKDREGKFRSTKSLLNEDGINMLMSIVSVHLNKNVALSNLEEKIVNNIMLNMMNTLTDLAYQKYVEWDAELEDLDMILTIIEHPVLIMLKRAEGKVTLDYLKSGFRSVETRVIGGREKKGFWSRVLPFRGGE